MILTPQNFGEKIAFIYSQVLTQDKVFIDIRKGDEINNNFQKKNDCDLIFTQADREALSIAKKEFRNNEAFSIKDLKKDLLKSGYEI